MQHIDNVSIMYVVHFSDMKEDTIEVFIDDFSVVGDSFDFFLDHLSKVLEWCVETNLVLN